MNDPGFSGWRLTPSSLRRNVPARARAVWASADDDEVVRPARHPISGRGHRVIEGRQENVRPKLAGYPALRDACLGRFPSSVGDHSCFEKVSDQSQHTSIADLIADQINKPILKANSRERQVRTRRSAGESRIRTVGTASQDQGLKIRRMRMPPSKRLTASA